MDFLLLIIGLILVVGGANYLTDGASSIAKKKGISPLVIGLTIVAFGTSAPELAVSLSSALKGNGDIAVGNVVGSNILNILLIGGAAAVLRPLSVSRSSVKYEIPLCILFSVILCLLGMDIPFWGSENNQLSRWDGGLLLICFVVFFAYTFWITTKSKKEAANASVEVKVQKLWLSALMVVGGLAGLIFGGDLFVDNAVAIAQRYHVSESVIGLTIVAIGTSLPELATSVVAAIKGEDDIAIGNIVGSNIFNLSFILGLSSCITPLSIKGIGVLDMSMMVGSAILLLFFGLLGGERKILRVEGAVFLLVFAVYVYLLLSKGHA